MTQPTFDSSKRIRDLTEVFVGREWLLREVDDFPQQDDDRYLVITAEPVIGKSAVAARLTKVCTIRAHYYCISRDGGRLDPVAFCAR